MVCLPSIPSLVLKLVRDLDFLEGSAYLNEAILQYAFVNGARMTVVGSIKLSSF